MKLILLIWLALVPAQHEPSVHQAVDFWRLYLACEVQYGQHDEAIAVEFRRQDEDRWLNSTVLGVSYAPEWGYKTRRVVLNADYPWTPWIVRETVKHELGHIIESRWGHRNAGVLQPYIWPEPRPRLLTWDDMERLLYLYSRVRPVPPASAGAWSP